MDWNPFDSSRYSDPRQNAWIHSQAPGSFHDVSAQNREVAITGAISLAPLFVVFVILWGNQDLVAFWKAHRGWAMLLQALAVASVLTALVRLGLVARERYATAKAEEGMPIPPVWFRLLLATMELGQVAAAAGVLLVQVLDLDRQWSDGALIGIAAAIGLAVGQRLIRWNAERYGWVTGRLLWGQFD